MICTRSVSQCDLFVLDDRSSHNNYYLDFLIHRNESQCWYVSSNSFDVRNFYSKRSYCMWQMRWSAAWFADTYEHVCGDGDCCLDCRIKFHTSVAFNHYIWRCTWLCACHEWSKQLYNKHTYTIEWVLCTDFGNNLYMICFVYLRFSCVRFFCFSIVFSAVEVFILVVFNQHHHSTVFHLASCGAIVSIHYSLTVVYKLHIRRHIYIYISLWNEVFYAYVYVRQITLAHQPTDIHKIQ